jgi:hypothetical protein
MAHAAHEHQKDKKAKNVSARAWSYPGSYPTCTGPIFGMILFVMMILFRHEAYKVQVAPTA